MNKNILRQAEDIKNKISEAIDEVRESAMYIDAILESKDKLELALMGAGKTIYLAQVLSPEQMKDIMDYITGKISESQAERETRLMMLITPGEEIIKESEPASEATTEKNEEIVIETPRKQIICKKTPIPEDEEEQYLRTKYVNEGQSVPQIASELGVGKSWVYDRIKKYKLREEKEGIPSWNIDEVKKLLKLGKTVKEIAAIYGIDKKEAYEKMAADGVSPSIYKNI